MKDRGANGAISMKFLEKMQAGGASKDLEFIICFFPGKKASLEIAFSTGTERIFLRTC